MLIKKLLTTVTHNNIYKVFCVNGIMTLSHIYIYIYIWFKSKSNNLIVTISGGGGIQTLVLLIKVIGETGKSKSYSIQLT